ncbi:hypothetical protein ON010_g3288 [Phytophthora cinnamomi]|nr:hypothetical protein ON010_g3288 [Phytophthora cinnamomi]
MDPFSYQPITTFGAVSWSQKAGHYDIFGRVRETMSVDVAAIRAAFAACNLDLEEDAASTCVSICTEFGLSSDDMAAQWDAYSMNQQLSGAANADGLVAFRSHLKQEKAKAKATETAPVSASQKRRHPMSVATPVVKREAESQDTLGSLPTGSNKVQRTSGMFSPTSLQSPPGNSYEKRTDAGKTVSEFNVHLRKQIEGQGANTGRPVKVAAPYPSRNLSPNASYMYTPLFQRAIALDEQLVEYEELVKEKFKIEALKPVGDPSPAQVTVVGRIVCEAAEGKLNPSVVQLEGTRKTCGGQRVLLDLSGVPNFQVFPGKIVALEGIFPDTRSPMTVKRFLEPIPAPPATSTPARIRDIQGEHGKPVRVLTACGPFTTTSNVDYLPLNDLLQIAIDQKPDVLILPPLNKKKACEAFEAAEYAKRGSDRPAVYEAISVRGDTRYSAASVDLEPFLRTYSVIVQRVKDSICINPGQLCKGESGGTFAHITILPLANDKVESATEDKCAHFVPDRAIVEIKRI